MKHSQTTRKGSFDLLRIILILMVCVLHACGRFDALFMEGTAPDAARYAGMALESLSIVAVNTWVIMSGYLMVNKEFKLVRFIELFLTIVFYALVGFLIVFILAKTNTSFSPVFQNALSELQRGGLFSVLQALFPISSEYYWFMTCYLLLYILTPLINHGARALTKKQYRTMLLLFLIWTSFIKSIVPVNFVTDDGGYGMKWFICLYLIGAYFKLEEIGFHADSQNTDDDSVSRERHVTPAKKRNVPPLFFYIASVLLIYLLSLILYKINLSTGKLAYFMTVPLHYNFILTLTGACGLFLCFKNMEINNKKGLQLISKLAPHTLGVYLLHAHPLLFYTWPALTKQLIGSVPRNHAALFILYVFVNMIVLFICGIIVDFLRSQCFLTARIVFKK